MRVMDIITEYKITGRKKKYKQGNRNSPSTLVQFARSLYKNDINVYETCYVIALHNQGVQGYMKVSQGARAATLIDIGLIGKFIVGTMSMSIVIVHNHPSGRTEFSREDKAMTQSLITLCNLIGAELVDSIVITDKGYLSMSEDGYLDSMQKKSKELINSTIGI